MFAYCNNNPANTADWNGHTALSYESTVNYADGLCSPFLPSGGGLLPAPSSNVDAKVFGASVPSAVIIISIATTVLSATIVSAIDVSSVDSSVVREKQSPILFPINPNDFMPIGLKKVIRPGTKNGALISWMDPVTNTEVFRWDENPNYSNGPHYHIYGNGHYIPGIDYVPEPYASLYFPYR